MTVDIAKRRALAAANADLIVGLVNEETEILDELERLRAENEQQRKAYLDVADALLCESKSPQDLVAAAQRLRRFRDTVLDHDEDCGECAECASEDGGLHEDLARERAERALAKVKP